MFKFKKLEIMANSRYALKAGVLLQAFSDASKACTNANLTDELAEYHLRTNPACRKYFSVIPGDVVIVPIKKRQNRIGNQNNIVPPVETNKDKGVSNTTEAQEEAIRVKLNNLKIDFHPRLGLKRLQELLIKAEEIEKPTVKSPSAAIKSKT